jgi:ABC-type lipopolysaccharide export system ATPase subunit
MSICDYIFVMDFGEKIFEGRPTDVATSSVVRAAYLGTEGVRPTKATPEVSEVHDGS